MAGFRPQDRELLTVMELALIESSRPAQIKLFTLAQLKAKITRARKYWDKYRTLARRQHRTNKTDPGSDRSQPFSNVRTERKGRLFAEALTQFEKRLAQIQRRDQPQKTRPRTKPSRTGTDPQAAQRASLRKRKQRREAAADSALTTTVTRQFEKSKLRAIQGHIRASGARRQGKRDSK
ncbi:MAG: hypothetical protein K0S58_1834 [Nitrospira sp.]|nr:hypothetical protein [Nitrospira sp.]